MLEYIYNEFQYIPVYIIIYVCSNMYTHINIYTYKHMHMCVFIYLFILPDRFATFYSSSLG